MSFDDAVALFTHFKSLGGHWRTATLRHCGLFFLIERFGDIDAIAEAVAFVAGNRAEKSRTFRDLRRLDAGLCSFRIEPESGRTQADLFTELRDKLVRAEAAA